MRRRLSAGELPFKKPKLSLNASKADTLLGRATKRGIFIAELRNLASHNELVLRNLKRHASGDDLSLGAIVAADTFKGYRQHEASIAVKEFAKRSGLKPVALKDIVLDILLTKDSDPLAFPERDNAVYLPLIGKSKAATGRSELTLKAHNYAQLVLDSSRVLAPYLASFFSSPFGVLSREQILSATFIPKITRRALLDATVYLPDVETQRRCIDCDSRSLNLISELQSLRDSMWAQPVAVERIRRQLEQVNRIENPKTWLDALPFPLASILWAYYASGENDSERVDHLLHFFEATAQFIAVLLWSTLRSSPSLSNHEKFPIGPDKPLDYSLLHSSFGSWVEMAGRLAKFTRFCMSSREESEAVFAAFHTRSRQTIQMLSSATVVEQAQKANALRNRLRHGGITAEQEARNNRIILENALALLRGEIGNVWDDIPLYKAGAGRLTNGVFRYEAELVMGRSTPFERRHVEVTSPIEDGALFLLAKDSREPAVLEPLIIVSASPQSAENACYFYNSTKGDEVRFVSYHFRGQPELIRTDERVTRALKAIETFS